VGLTHSFPSTVPSHLIGRLCKQGRTVREIAGELGMSRSLVHKTLANGESCHAANKAS